MAHSVTATAFAIIGRKEKRADAPAPEVLDPAKAQIDYADNERGAINKLLALNAYYRTHPWPAPFDRTEHRLKLGDARDLSWIPNGSVHLVVTSPPYWTLKKYEENEHQLGEIADYNAFLDELDKVWRECARVLAPGGRICCVVGDVCIPRRQGRHLVMPLHADIMVRARALGLDALTPILWFKIANGVTEAKGNGSGFYGKPYQPGAIIKNDAEYILFLRKGGEYRSPSSTQKALSMLTKEEMKSWLRSAWVDIKGESTRRGHPAPYPQSLAERLIKLFSFAGDTVLDPFVGTGTTNLAAVSTGRNSIGNEIEPAYLKIAEQRLQLATAMPRPFGATHSTFEVQAMSEEKYTLLQTFRSLFEGKQYPHRKSNLGDLVASRLYEDLVAIGKSTTLVEGVQRHERVVNIKNVMTGKPARRGDGTFGELVPSAVAVIEKGMLVARGPVATIEIGAETKILAKAMIKQIDRVINDLVNQVSQFKRGGGSPICVAFVGINFAEQYVSFEGRKRWPTDGKKYKHPIQEAAQAEQRLNEKARSAFDEFQILRFRATNAKPFPFDWVDLGMTEMEYSSVLTRVSREYDRRFA